LRAGDLRKNIACGVRRTLSGRGEQGFFQRLKRRLQLGLVLGAGFGLVAPLLIAHVEQGGIGIRKAFEAGPEIRVHAGKGE